MVLPNFLVVGSPKCGTTNLCFQLLQHPDIFISKKKELDFFNRQYSLGQNWYESQFEGWNNESAIGEGSVLYGVTSLCPDVAHRIAKMLPDAKLIYMVRHPIDRLESMWCQHVANGDHIPEFNQAVREWRPLIDGSLYWHQIQLYRQHFSDDKILLLFLDDYKKDSLHILRRCYEFLGVDPTFKVSEKYLNNRGNLPVDTMMWGAVRHTMLGRAIRRNFPENIKDVFRRVFRRPMGSLKPKWEESTLRWAIKLVEDDARKFLELASREQSEWDFDENFVIQKLANSPETIDPIQLRKRKNLFVLSHILDYEKR